MKIIHKYILKHFILILIASNLATVLLFLIVSVLERVNYLMGTHKLTLFQVFLYFSYQAPQVSYYSAPLSVLFGLLLTIGILAQRNELTIIRVSGMSWSKIMRLPFIITLIYAWLIYLCGGYLIPFANQKSRAMESKETKGQTNIPIAKQWLFNRSDPTHQFAIYLDLYLPEKKSIKEIQIFVLNSDFFPLKELRAQSAEYIDSDNWLLQEVKVIDFQSGSAPVMQKIPELRLNLPIHPKDLLSLQKYPAELTTPELDRYISQMEKFGLNPKEFRVERASRYSLPVSCLIMLGLAVGVSIRAKKPKGIYYNLGIALLITFSYFALMAECLSLGKSEKLSPVLSAWLANFAYGLICLYFFVSKEKA